MAKCKENEPAPLHCSNVGLERKQKLYRIATIKQKSITQMVRDWIDGLREGR